MGKVKFVFSVMTLVISVLLIINTVKFEGKSDPLKYTPPPFQITGISENGKLFQDLSLSIPLTVESGRFKNNLRIKTDPRTSFEVIFKGTLLIILPNSYIFYNVNKQTLSLISGEIIWTRLTKYPTSIYTKEESSPITISRSGRVLITGDNRLYIWSYRGGTTLKSGEVLIEIPERKSLFIDEEKIQKMINIPPAITFIAPKEQDVYIKKLTDFLVKIDWKAIPGITNYKVKVYPSKLKENTFIEKIVSFNRTGLDLAEFERNREFFWEIIPLTEEMYEGEPSRMGKIRLFGVMLKEERDNHPSKLTISSMDVTGDTVTIKGNTNADAKLYINEISVAVGITGNFTFTKTYTTLGLKKITFRVISPLGVESTLIKQVTINEE